MTCAFPAYNAMKGGSGIRLKTKRYRVRKRRGGMFLILLLLGAGIFLLLRSGRALPVFFSPAPPLTPEESAQETRTPVLPGKTRYALQLGAFSEENAAQALDAQVKYCQLPCILSLADYAAALAG